MAVIHKLLMQYFCKTCSKPTPALELMLEVYTSVTFQIHHGEERFEERFVTVKFFFTCMFHSQFIYTVCELKSWKKVEIIKTIDKTP